VHVKLKVDVFSGRHSVLVDVVESLVKYARYIFIYYTKMMSVGFWFKQ